MPRLIMPGSRLKAEVSRAPRANRHWTDEEYASRFLGELHAMDQRDARWGSILRGVATVGLFVVVGMLVMGL